MIHPRPFASPAEALHFLASTASAVPEEPGTPPGWRAPDRVAAEAAFRVRRDPEAALLYLAGTAEMVAEMIAEGDLWIASANLAAAAEARFRGIVAACGSAILADVAGEAFPAIAADLDAALWAVNAVAETDCFWEE
jgi:hypothetical protein